MPSLISSYTTWLQWLQGHLISCPFKYLTGIDCPGCGFQRSVTAFLQGQVKQSILLYPPAIPLLLFFAYLAIAGFRRKRNANDTVKKYLFLSVCLIVFVSYGLKLAGYTFVR